jgi:hypothetical protein
MVFTPTGSRPYNATAMFLTKVPDLDDEVVFRPEPGVRVERPVVAVAVVSSSPVSLPVSKVSFKLGFGEIN